MNRRQIRKMRNKSSEPCLMAILVPSTPEECEVAIKKLQALEKTEKEQMKANLRKIRARINMLSLKTMQVFGDRISAYRAFRHDFEKILAKLQKQPKKPAGETP